MIIPKDGNNIVRLPASATGTYERLLVYCALALEASHPSQSRLQERGDLLATKVVQRSIFEDADNSTSMALRLLVNLDPTWTTDNTKKLWEFVNELATGTSVLSRFLP